VEDRDVRRTRITLIAPALLMLYGMAMPFVLLNFYVRPYQRGAGTILPGNALNWSEAEPWIAFGPAALFIPLGLLAFVTIRRRYRPLNQGA
jgi:sodium/pantothenate symporter